MTNPDKISALQNELQELKYIVIEMIDNHGLTVEQANDGVPPEPWEQKVREYQKRYSLRNVY